MGWLHYLQKRLGIYIAITQWVLGTLWHCARRELIFVTLWIGLFIFGHFFQLSFVMLFLNGVVFPDEPAIVSIQYLDQLTPTAWLVIIFVVLLSTQLFRYLAAKMAFKTESRLIHHMTNTGVARAHALENLGQEDERNLTRIILGGSRATGRYVRLLALTVQNAMIALLGLATLLYFLFDLVFYSLPVVILALLFNAPLASKTHQYALDFEQQIRGFSGSVNAKFKHPNKTAHEAAEPSTIETKEVEDALYNRLITIARSRLVFGVTTGLAICVLLALMSQGRFVEGLTPSAIIISFYGLRLLLAGMQGITVFLTTTGRLTPRMNRLYRLIEKGKVIIVFDDDDDDFDED